MPSFFCGHCAASITYEAVKPNDCPKCKRALASAFTPPKSAAPVPLPPTPRVPDDVDDELEDGELETRATRKSVRSLRRPAKPLAEYRDESGNLEEIDTGADELGVEYVDPRERRRQARQLAASIKIRVQDQEDDDTKPIRFGDWCGKPKEQ